MHEMEVLMVGMIFGGMAVGVIAYALWKFDEYKRLINEKIENLEQALESEKDRTSEKYYELSNEQHKLEDELEELARRI